MPDEVGTEATRPDAPGAGDGLFGDALDDRTVAAVEGEDSRGQTAPEGSGDSADRAADDPQGSDVAGGDAPAEDLKVVLSIKGGRAVIGVQRPESDPHIETFDGGDLAGLTDEVPAVVERAKAGWEESPKHPTYARPATPARSRNRRGQGSAQDAPATAEAEQAQQQTLRLF